MINETHEDHLEPPTEYAQLYMIRHRAVCLSEDCGF